MAQGGTGQVHVHVSGLRCVGHVPLPAPHDGCAAAGWGKPSGDTIAVPESEQNCANAREEEEGGGEEG